MKNSLADVNNHLVAQLERLNNEDLTNEKLELEIKRTDSITKITKITKQIISNADLRLKAFEIQSNSPIGQNIPKQIGDNKDEI